MKKIPAIITVILLVFAMTVPVFAADVFIDYNTEDGRATSEFFGEGCTFRNDDWPMGGTYVAYLINKNNGQDATEENGGLYNNGITVKFSSDKAGPATVTLSLVCPDHSNGASGYALLTSINGSDYTSNALDNADHKLFDYSFTVNVAKGENKLNLVQSVRGKGNNWRIDIATVSINLPTEDTPVSDATTTAPSTTADPGTVNPPTSDAPMIAAVSVLGACALGAVVFAAVCTKKRGAK